MKVDTKEVNPDFLSIIRNPSQKVFLDANFFIPPDRSDVAKVKDYSFTDFKECWPSISTIADEIKLSRATVKRALIDLKQARLIETEQRYRTKGGKSSLLYRIK